MRASPLLQWILFLVFWALLALPIIGVTRARTTERPVAVQEEPATTAWVSIQFSSVPTRFSLEQAGQVLWQGVVADGQKQFERELPVVFDSNGTEFWLKADLADEDSVVEVSVEADDRAARARTVWGDGRQIDEPLRFSWGAHE